jgi:hypothetical protein
MDRIGTLNSEIVEDNEIYVNEDSIFEQFSEPD